MENFRLFVGLSLSPDVTDRLSSIMDRMAAQLPFRRWTHPADLHVTLHFLGDTPPMQVDAIRDAVADTAAETAPLPLAISGPGTFGPPHAPRVLWCALTEPASAGGGLAALYAALAPRLAAAGSTIEARPFRAHITMARQGGAGCGRDAVEAAWHAAVSANDASPEPLAWTAHDVTLYRSHLGRRPSYERLQDFPLTGAAK